MDALSKTEVFVTGVDMSQITKEELRAHMEQAGAIELLQMRGHPGRHETAIVTFSNEVSARLACNKLHRSTIYTQCMESFTIYVKP